MSNARLGGAAYSKDDGAQVIIEINQSSVQDFGSYYRFTFVLGAIGIVKGLPDAAFASSWTYPNKAGYSHPYMIDLAEFEVVGHPPSGKAWDSGAFLSDTNCWQENNEHYAVYSATPYWKTMQGVSSIIADVSYWAIGYCRSAGYKLLFGGVYLIASAISGIAATAETWGPYQVLWWTAYDNYARFYWEYFNAQQWITGVPSLYPGAGPEVSMWGCRVRWDVPKYQNSWYGLDLKATIGIGHWQWVGDTMHWACVHDYYLSVYRTAMVAT
jgi:hypothetical protein